MGILGVVAALVFSGVIGGPEVMTCPECGRAQVRSTRIACTKAEGGTIEVLAAHMEARWGPLGPYVSRFKCELGSHMPLSEARERNLHAAQEEAAAADRRRSGRA